MDHIIWTIWYVAYHKVHKTSNDIAVSNMGTAYVVQKYSESLEFSISWRMKIQGNFRKYQEYFEFSKELSCKSNTGYI